MKLDNIAANIRLRKNWEAFDLGLSMVQAWWKHIYLPWALLMTLILIPLIVLANSDYAGWTIFILWWLKPLYDRFLLNILSHQLFSEQKTTRQALKELPKLIRSTGLLHGLTIGRLSPARGLSLPIWQLEQLKGKARQKRQKVVHGEAYTSATFFTVAMLHFELILGLLVYGIIIMFIPQELLVNIFDRIKENIFDFTHLIDQISLITYAFAVLVLEPIYVAGTFSLYLNRRTELEAWDIELNFRQMANRLEKLQNSKSMLSTMLALPALLLVLGMVTPTPALADGKGIQATEEYLSPTLRPIDDAKAVASEILEGEEFSKHETKEVWRLKFENDDKETNSDLDLGFFSTFASILKILLIAGLAFLIVYLIVKRDQWLEFFKGTPSQKETYQAPDILFGMDIRPESLPDNLPEAARHLWQQGQLREAMSLLYRGALARLVNVEHVALHSGHTEGDVVNLAKQHLQNQQFVYLKSLTKHWQMVAYAHRNLSDEIIEHLLNNWFDEFDMDKSQEAAT